MLRLTPLITTLVLLFAPTAAQAASPTAIFADCEDNGRLDKRYSDADLREARDGVPDDLNEYSDCKGLITAQLAGVDTSGNGNGNGGGAGGTGGSGGTGGDGQRPQGLPEGNGVGSVPLDQNGKPLDPLIDAQQDERAAVESAAAGVDITPTSAGVRPGEPDPDLPTPLIVLLALTAVAAVAAAARAVTQRVAGRPA